MFRAILGVALVVLPASLASGQGAGPKGLPPTIMAVRVDGAGQPFLVVMKPMIVPRQETVQVKVGNEIQNRVQMRLVMQMIEMRKPLDSEKVRFFDAAGKRIDFKEALKRLTKMTAVFVSADGKEVDPFYLRLAREDTVVVVSPELAGPDLGGPVAIPPPPPLQPKLPELKPKLPSPG
jgi:hypothetical protein